MCLNAFAAHIPDDGQPSFFSIEKIPAYSDHSIRKAEQTGSRFSNDQKGLNLFFETVKPAYENANVIETPLIPKKHLSPTSLASTMDISGIKSAGRFISHKNYSGEGAADIFGKVDALLERYARRQGEEKFDYASFGTLAHLCVEALLAEREASIPPQLAGPLSPADAEAFLEAGRECALRFLRSPLGSIAKGAQMRKSEFRFRSLLPLKDTELFINGTIDLVFEDAETVYVLDFKTDSEEAPEKHLAQMACYYRAVYDLFAKPAKKEARAWLYYLRSGNAVDVSREAGEFSF